MVVSVLTGAAAGSIDCSAASAALSASLLAASSAIRRLSAFSLSFSVRASLRLNVLKKYALRDVSSSLFNASIAVIAFLALVSIVSISALTDFREVVAFNHFGL